MDVEELRDLDDARQFVADGLALMRAVRPNPATVRAALDWAMEVAAAGHPLPPVGFIADVGHIALGADADHRVKEASHAPGWPAGLARQYEDHVLGKLYSDHLFERAGDALKKLPEKDRVRGLAYIVRTIRDAGRFPGVHLAPAVIRGLQRQEAPDVWLATQERGPNPRLVSMYERMVAAARRSSQFLEREHVEKLEAGLAFGDSLEVAWDQLEDATRAFLVDLPEPRRARQRDLAIPTKLHDHDQYPVGGYSSISTKGSVESLLHSQLAYIEDRGDHPDLFDVKFARDELFYYSRDENQFLRRRRAFAFLLHSDLKEARFKDPELKYQRIIMLLGLVHAVVRWYKERLGRDSGDAYSLRFEILFVGDEEVAPLADELRLCELQLRGRLKPEEYAVERVKSAAAAADRLRAVNERMQLNVLEATADKPKPALDGIVPARLVVSGPAPRLHLDGAEVPLDGEPWHAAAARLLDAWN